MRASEFARRFSGLVVLSVFLQIASSKPGTAQQTAGSDAANVVALRGAMIHTMSDQGSFVGTVLVEDGKITAVGTDLAIPENAEVIELPGYILVPGLIDSRSVLWLTQAARSEASSTAALDVVDGIDPWQNDWQEVAAQGVTAVYVQPGNQSALGGHGAVLCVAPAASAEELILKSEAGVQAAIGITGSTSRDRFTQYQRLQQAIQNAKEGKQTEQAQENAESEDNETAETPTPPIPGRGFRGFGNRGRSQPTAVTPPSRAKEVLTQVLDGKLPLRVEVHHSDALRSAISLAEEFGIRVIIEGAAAPASQLDNLLQSQMPLVVGPLWQAGDPPSYRKTENDPWIGRLADHPATWSIGTFADRPRASRLVRANAALAVAAGVPADQVLRAVTINAARLAGVDDQIGSIEVGKRADLAVFAGHPLDPSSAARLVLSAGRIVHRADVPARAPFDRAVASLPERLPGSFAVKTNRALVDGQFVPLTLLVRDGRFVEAAAHLPVDDSMATFDLGDAVLTAGLVASHCHLAADAALTDNTESDASHLRAVDVVDPRSKAAGKMLEGGFINIAFAPPSNNTSSGVVGWLRLGAANVVQSPAIAGKLVLADSARGAERFPVSLPGQVAMLESLLQGDTPRTRLYVSQRLAQSFLAEKQNNIRALRGERAVVVFAESRAEIEAALKLVEQYKLHGALLGPRQFERYLPQIKALGLGIIAGAVDGEEYQTYFQRLAQAAKAGVPVSFSGNSPEQMRLSAALSVSSGLPEEAALRGLTNSAAAISGMPAGAAALAAGGPADFVIWSGSPIDLQSKPLHIVVDGQLINN